MPLYCRLITARKVLWNHFNIYRSDWQKIVEKYCKVLSKCELSAPGGR